MSALTAYLKQKAPELLQAAGHTIAKHPGKTAAALGIGAAGAAAGTYAGVKATEHEMPYAILERMGLPRSLADSGGDLAHDAMKFAKKHPVAAGMIGAGAVKGAGQSVADVASMVNPGQTLKQYLAAELRKDQERRMMQG